jgi:hypothetical protein
MELAEQTGLSRLIGEHVRLPSTRVKSGAAGAEPATIMLRGDSAFGTKKVIGACLAEYIEFSLALSRNTRVTKAINEDAFTPRHEITDPRSQA